jgi:hypothetical protein
VRRIIAALGRGEAAFILDDSAKKIGFAAWKSGADTPHSREMKHG